MAVEALIEIESAVPSGHDRDLVLRQQGKFLESYLFIMGSLDKLEAAHIRNGTDLVLGDQLVSWARSPTSASAVPILRVFATAFGNAASLDRIDPDLLSLCVLVSGALVEELVSRGMAEDLCLMTRMYPKLDLPWCHALFRRESLASLSPVGVA